MRPFCLAILTLVSIGCTRTTTYSNEDGVATFKQEFDGKSSMTFTSKDGKVITLNTTPGKIPDDYPKDVPIYPGVTPNLAQSTPEQSVLTLLLESHDPADKIFDFYKKGLNSNGWKIESWTAGDVSTLTALKEARQATVTVINTGDRRSITQVLLHR